MLTAITLDYQFIRCEVRRWVASFSYGYVENDDIITQWWPGLVSLVRRNVGGCNRELPSNALYHPIIVLGILILIVNVIIFVFVLSLLYRRGQYSHSRCRCRSRRRPSTIRGTLCLQFAIAKSFCKTHTVLCVCVHPHLLHYPYISVCSPKSWTFCRSTEWYRDTMEYLSSKRKSRVFCYLKMQTKWINLEWS